MIKKYNLQNLCCQNCLDKITKKIKKEKYIDDVNASLMVEELEIDYNSYTKENEENIIKIIKKIEKDALVEKIEE